MNSYELMVIYNPNKSEADIKKHFETVKERIKSLGGKVTAEDFWGLKDLAYMMKGFKQAYYIVFQVEMDAVKTKDFVDYLNRQEDFVVRSMLSSVENSVEKD